MGVLGYAKGLDARAIGDSSDRPADTATLMGVLSTVNDANQMLSETAEIAERIATQVSGAVPASDGATAKNRSGDCIVDALNERANALRDPAVRIRNALARIERRIGA